jgi:hypothetical protein
MSSCSRGSISFDPSEPSQSTARRFWKPRALQDACRGQGLGSEACWRLAVPAESRKRPGEIAKGPILFKCSDPALKNLPAGCARHRVPQAGMECGTTGGTDGRRKALRCPCSSGAVRVRPRDRSLVSSKRASAPTARLKRPTMPQGQQGGFGGRLLRTRLSQRLAISTRPAPRRARVPGSGAILVAPTIQPSGCSV